MLGAATDGHWDSSDPLPMTATSDKDVLSRIGSCTQCRKQTSKFSVDINTWDKAHFLVPALESMEEGQAYAFLKEG